MVKSVSLMRPGFLQGPGTSLRLPGTSQGGGPTPAVRYSLQGIAPIFALKSFSLMTFLTKLWILHGLRCLFWIPRPMTQSGRPITGFVRPSTQSGRPGTMEQAIKTPRTANTARPVTSASGRFIRLGTVSKHAWERAVMFPKTKNSAHLNINYTYLLCYTLYWLWWKPVLLIMIYFSLFLQASMLTNPEGPFINLSRLNLAKYSQRPNLSGVRRILFTWITIIAFS